MVIELLFWLESMVFKYFSDPNTRWVMTLPSVILILFSILFTFWQSRCYIEALKIFCLWTIKLTSDYY